MILAVILLTLAMAKKPGEYLSLSIWSTVSLVYTDYILVMHKHSNNLFFAHSSFSFSTGVVPFWLFCY